MLKIAICDDNVPLCEQLAAMLENIGQELEEHIAVETFYTAERLWKAMQENAAYELIFLDIELPGENGLTVARRIREERDNYDVQIAYISAKTQYMPEAFAVHPIHFLVKPLKREAVRQVVQETLKMRPREMKYFAYTQERLNKRMARQQILYLTVMGKELTLLLTDGDAITCRMSMKDAMKQLTTFAQISQSVAINPRYVQRYSTSYVYLKGDVVLAISPRYKEAALLKLKGADV